MLNIHAYKRIYKVLINTHINISIIIHCNTHLCFEVYSQILHINIRSISVKIYIHRTEWCRNHGFRLRFSSQSTSRSRAATPSPAARARWPWKATPWWTPRASDVGHGVTEVSPGVDARNGARHGDWYIWYGIWDGISIGKWMKMGFDGYEWCFQWLFWRDFWMGFI